MCVFWITYSIPITFLFIFMFANVVFGQPAGKFQPKARSQWPADISLTAAKVMAHLERTGNLLMTAYPRALLTAQCDSLFRKKRKKKGQVPTSNV